MSTLNIPLSIIDRDEVTMVCVFCDNIVTDIYCADCMEYKGLMTIAEWEEYTGEVWDA